MVTENSDSPMSFDQFKQVLAEVLMTDPDRLVPEAHFITDLAVDSIRLVELLLRFEEMGIEISPDAVWTIQTVGDAYNHYREHATAQ
jgi:acyl carrier protein